MHSNMLQLVQASTLTLARSDMSTPLKVTRRTFIAFGGAAAP